MALDFPNSPTNGQTFTSGNLTWTWNSTTGAWKGQLSAISEISGGVAGALPYQSGTSDTSFTAAGTTGQVLLSGGTGSPTWSNTIAGATLTTATLTSPAVNNAVLGGQAIEAAYTTSTAFSTSGYTFDVTTNGAVQYITANSTGNGTVNIRSTAGTALNTLLGVGQAVTLVLLITNGTTAYYPTAWQIDGSAVTPKWSGGTAPTGGNASSIDAYTVTIIKTASATFTVLASQTKFA